MTDIGSYISQKLRVIGRYARKIFSQGLSPHELSLSVAVAIFWGLFPFPGVATPVITFICLKWRLNLPIAMFLAYAIIPIQVGLFIPLIYAGEWICGADHLPISFAALQHGLKDDLLMTLVQRAGQICYGVMGWLVLILPISVMLYYILKTVLGSRLDN